MKKLITLIAIVFTAALLISPISADKENTSAVIDSVTLTDSLDGVTVSVSISEAFAASNDKLYLFRLPPGSSGTIDGFIPTASTDANEGKATFTLSFDKTDDTSALYSYLIAESNGNGGYTPLGMQRYLGDITTLSENDYEYPRSTSKKGLQVQLTADAQLIGIKHTVVNVSLGDLISDDADKSDMFIFGNKEYLIDRSALSMLDYRIKTLTDAGIHIYMNLILTFDATAPSSLYYPDALNSSSTAYALNVSDTSYVIRAAAYINYLASRYTDENGLYGFCGSYIIGYEVNGQSDTNNAGMTDKREYMTACATLLRTADTAARLAYSNARVYTSISNVWNTDSENAETIGASEYLTFLAETCSDVPFGISINPYPSLLGMTEYWNDELATDSPTTQFVTMKNLNVFTDFLKTEAMLDGGKPRRALIGEFGLDGKYGTVSEEQQAAGYAYAYYTAQSNDLIEAFIWHRHVDHSGETGYYYGIFTSSESLLTPKHEKLIHSVIAAVDLTPEQRDKILTPLLSLLPVATTDELIGDTVSNRSHIDISGTNSPSADSVGRKEYLFDFSESTYSFYPSDNSQYLELIETDGEKFMRTRLINVAPVEFMGISGTLPDASRLASADYISVKVRAVSYATAVDFRLLISGDGLDDDDTVIDCTSTLICNEWTELYFPIGSAAKDLKSVKLRIWIRGGSEKDTDIWLDVSNVKLCSADPTAGARRVFIGILTVAMILAVLVIAVLTVSSLLRKKRKRRSKRRVSSGNQQVPPRLKG